jgi:hypothetical protein
MKNNFALLSREMALSQFVGAWAIVTGASLCMTAVGLVFVIAGVDPQVALGVALLSVVPLIVYAHWRLYKHQMSHLPIPIGIVQPARKESDPGSGRQVETKSAEFTQYTLRMKVAVDGRLASGDLIVFSKLSAFLPFDFIYPGSESSDHKAYLEFLQGTTANEADKRKIVSTYLVYLYRKNNNQAIREWAIEGLIHGVGKVPGIYDNVVRDIEVHNKQGMVGDDNNQIAENIVRHLSAKFRNSNEKIEDFYKWAAIATKVYLIEEQRKNHEVNKLPRYKKEPTLAELAVLKDVAEKLDLNDTEKGVFLLYFMKYLKASEITRVLKLDYTEFRTILKRIRRRMANAKAKEGETYSPFEEFFDE